MLVASVVAGILTVLITESLSLADAISRGPLATAWATIAIATVILAARSRRPGAASDLGEWLRGENLVIAGTVGLLLLLTLIVGVVSGPNTPDSLVYHMARVAHWAQNEDVAMYPTNILRQLHPAPFAEFVILHFQVLTGGDRFASLAQWSAVAGLGLAASVIARELGATRRGQLLSALIVVSTPIVVAEASSTQTDAVVGFWLAAFAALMLMDDGLAMTTAVLLGACLGLAALTKGTAYVYGLPLVIWMITTRVKAGPLVIVRSLAIAFTVAAILNIGFYARNQRVYGSPLGPAGESPQRGQYTYANDAHGPRAITSNVVRNLALHLGTPSSRVNAALTSVIAASLRTVGIDPNDSRTTWTDTAFKVDWCFSDSCAGNPLQLALAAGCFALALLVRDPGSRAPGLTLVVLGGLVLFAALLKWQPWHSRLQLPLFALAAPVVGTVVDRHARRWVRSLLITALAVCAFAVLLLDPLRPLGGANSVFARSREESYLLSHQAMSPWLLRAMDAIAATNCRDIGLLSVDADEYAVWVYAANHLPARPRIEHVGVHNASAFLAGAPPYSTFAPCAVIALDRDGGPALQVGDRRFARREIGARTVQLYLPAPEPIPTGRTRP